MSLVLVTEGDCACLAGLGHVLSEEAKRIPRYPWRTKREGAAQRRCSPFFYTTAVLYRGTVFRSCYSIVKSRFSLIRTVLLTTSLPLRS